jgi:hypothetical protein
VFYFKLEEISHRKSVHKPLFTRVRVRNEIDQFVMRDLIEVVPRDDTRAAHYLSAISRDELGLFGMFLEIPFVGEVWKGRVKDIQNQFPTINQMPANTLQA